MTTVPKPTVILPSPPVSSDNIWRGSTSPTKLFIVCHIMQGTFDGCIEWFANPAAQASSNFGVAKDGRAAMWVDPTGPNSPYANGLVDQPDAAVAAWISRTGGRNLNFTSVSIEHEGMPGDELTPAQLHASSQIAAYFIQLYGMAADPVSLDSSTLLGHFEIDSVNRKFCPGWTRAQWLAYEAAVIAWLTLKAPTSDPEAQLRAQLLTAQQQNTALGQQLADANTQLTRLQAQLTGAPAQLQQAQFSLALINSLSKQPPDDIDVYKALDAVYKQLTGGKS